MKIFFYSFDFSLTILGIIISLAILSKAEKLNLANKFLGAYFLIQSIISFSNFAVFGNTNPFTISIIYAHFSPIFFLAPACSYLHIRNLLLQTKLSRFDLLHLLPAIFQVINIANYAFTVPLDNKKELIEKVINENYEFTTLDHHFIFPVSYNFILLPIVSIFYAALSVKHWQRFNSLTITKQTHPFYSATTISAWVPIFIGWLFFKGYLSIFVAGYLHFDKQRSNIIVYDSFSLLVFAQGFFLMATLFLYPKIIYGENNMAISQPVNKAPATASQKQAPESQVLLSESLQVKIDHFENQPIWIDSQLKFHNLIDILQAQEPELAIYYKSMGIAHFQKCYKKIRIKRACHLMCHPDFAHFSLEAIAKMAGFKSRSHFYRIFKDAYQITPAQYQRNQGKLKSTSDEQNNS